MDDSLNNMQAWLGLDFWQGVLRDIADWVIRTAPSLLLLGLATLIALRVTVATLSRLHKRLVSRREEDEEHGGDHAEYEKRVETLVGISRRTLMVAIWSLFGLLALAEVGLDIGPLIAGAGVVGLALGFGAQELVRDVISGFFVLLENHVRTGDVAVINGTGGLVESIGLRTIRLRDLSGVVHVFQNGKIDTLANMTKGWSAMVFEMGVAYKEDTDRVCEVMTQVAERQRGEPEFAQRILEPLEIFGVDAFGDSAVVIKARLKTLPGEQWSVGREYRRRLKYAFDEVGIEIPFPHRTLYWGEASPPLEFARPARKQQEGNGAALRAQATDRAPHGRAGES